MLQPPSAECAECGAAAVAPVAIVRELIAHRTSRAHGGAAGRHLGLAAAFLAGSALAAPALAPVALGVLAAAVGQRAHARRARRALPSAVLPAAAPPPGAVTLHGVARRFRATIASILDEAPLLLEHVAVVDRAGGVVVRWTASAPFWLELDAGATAAPSPVLVTGAARVAPASMLVRRVPVARGAARLAHLGLPPELLAAGALEVVAVPADAGELAVTGTIEEEALAELAFHRAGGRAAVMRGRAGAPVLVAERRLIAVGL